MRLAARPLRGLSAATALWCLAAPTGAGGLPLLSEVLYDAVGSDEGVSFVEISAPPGTVLDGLLIEGINGANGEVAGSIALSGVVAADGLFVVGDDTTGGATLVAEADAVASFDFQNGPDSVVLRDAAGIFDALGYGVFAPGEFFAGEGDPAPDAPAGSSLARLFADVDTNDNASDFGVGSPTPGSAAFAIPEPGGGALVASGLIGLAWQGRRRRNRAHRR